MYNPVRFECKDLEEALNLVEHYPFAILISQQEGLPFISHLPLIGEREGDQLVLTGHLAKANPHERILRTQPVTVVFRGAHTFITPIWYPQENVPTWNYSALHLTGRAEILENFEDTVSCLKKLTHHMEKLYPSGWNFFMPEDLDGPHKLLKGISGFRIRVDSFQFKRKLSQNRNAEEIAGVLKGLAERTDDESKGVLRDMRKIHSEE